MQYILLTFCKYVLENKAENGLTGHLNQCYYIHPKIQRKSRQDLAGRSANITSVKVYFVHQVTQITPICARISPTNCLHSPCWRQNLRKQFSSQPASQLNIPMVHREQVYTYFLFTLYDMLETISELMLRNIFLHNTQETTS